MENGEKENDYSEPMARACGDGGVATAQDRTTLISLCSTCGCILTSCVLHRMLGCLGDFGDNGKTPFLSSVYVR